MAYFKAVYLRPFDSFYSSQCFTESELGLVCHKRVSSGGFGRVRKATGVSTHLAQPTLQGARLRDIRAQGLSVGCAHATLVRFDNWVRNS